MFYHRGTSNQYSNRFKPLEGSSHRLYISGIQRGVVHDGLSGVGDRKVLVSQGSYGVATGQSWHLGESGPSKIEDAVCIQIVSIVEMPGMGQSRSERVVEIGGSLCCRVVIESRLDDCYIQQD